MAAEKSLKGRRKAHLFLVFAVLVVSATTIAYIVFYAIPRLKSPKYSHHHFKATVIANALRLGKVRL